MKAGSGRLLSVVEEKGDYGARHGWMEGYLEENKELQVSGAG